MVGSIWWPVGCQSWVHLMAVKHQDIHFPGCWRGGSNKSFGNLTNLNTLLANIMVLLILIMIISSDRKTLKFGFHPNCPGGAPSFRKNHFGFSRQARTMPWTEKLHSWQQLVGSFKSKKWKNAPWTITARLFCQKKGNLSQNSRSRGWQAKRLFILVCLHSKRWVGLAVCELFTPVLHLER